MQQRKISNTILFLFMIFLAGATVYLGRININENRNTTKGLKIAFLFGEAEDRDVQEQKKRASNYCEKTQIDKGKDGKIICEVIDYPVDDIAEYLKGLSNYNFVFVFESKNQSAVQQVNAYDNLYLYKKQKQLNPKWQSFIDFEKEIRKKLQEEKK